MSIATSNVQSVWKLWQMSNQFEMIRSYQNAVFSVSPITFIYVLALPQNGASHGELSYQKCVQFTPLSIISERGRIQLKVWLIHL